jgi:PIN domain nuclease of toxin-antitoxin system
MLSEPEHLSRAALRELEAGGEGLFLSVASMWEIAIKWSKGKLSLPEHPQTHIPSRMQALGMQVLAISPRHAIEVANMPALHGDPFDRLLIAQALVEGMTLISSDAVFKNYPVPLLWAGR